MNTINNLKNYTVLSYSNNNEKLMAKKTPDLEDLKSIKNIENQLIKIDSNIEKNEKKSNSPANKLNNLLAIAAQQKKLAADIASSTNSDMNIALLIASSIEFYTDKLAYYHIDKIIRIMFEDLKNKDLKNDPFAMEDMFQLAIIAFLAHGYGDPESEMHSHLFHFIESTGSGSHGVHENYDGEKFSKILPEVYDYIKDNSPEGSLCSEIMDELDSNGGKEALALQYNDHFYSDGAFITIIGGENGTGGIYKGNISPMLRLSIYAQYVSEYGAVSDDERQIFLTGSLEEIDEIFKNNPDIPNDNWNTPNSTAETPQFYDVNAINYLIYLPNNSEWRFVKQKIGEEQRLVFDWNGVGIDKKYLSDLMKNEVLNETDMKEINKINDHIKTLQLLLKNWINIMKEEQLAIARNI